MLDLKSLDAALAHLPYWGTRKFIAKNSSTGRNEWRALDSNDIPTLTSSKISDFTEAAQDAVGAMAASSSKVSLTYVDGTPSLTADIVAGSLGTADIANRTRRIPLTPLSPAIATDTHGSLGNVIHIDLADGAIATIYYSNVALPADWAAGLNLVIVFSSTAAGNNIKMFHYVEALLDQDATAAEVLLSTGYVARAANATADKTQRLSVALSVNPSNANCGLNVILIFDRTDGAVDTNTGTVSIWDAYIEYTADS